MPADSFNPDNPDGKVRFVMDGTTFVLRRPKIGEFRKLREGLLELARTAAGDDEEAEQIAEEVSTGKRDPAEIAARESDLIAWWIDVFTVLEEKGQALPAEDDLPTWLIGQLIVPQTVQAWLSRPGVPGS